MSGCLLEYIYHLEKRNKNVFLKIEKNNKKKMVRSGLAHIGIGVIRPQTQNTPIFGFGSGFGNFQVFAHSTYIPCKLV